MHVEISMFHFDKIIRYTLMLCGCRGSGRGGPGTSTTSGLSEAGKFSLGPVSQSFKHTS